MRPWGYVLAAIAVYVLLTRRAGTTMVSPDVLDPFTGEPLGYRSLGSLRETVQGGGFI